MKPPLADLPIETAERDAFTIRPAVREDAGALRELLDAIVRRGGTTAIERTPGVIELADWFIDGEGCLSCLVAEATSGDGPSGRERSARGDTASQHVGFQSIGTHDELPVGCADIATFAHVAHAGRGIGAALFERTVARARELGLEALNATIRADNTAGLAFYTRLGFTDHSIERDVPLADGTPVDRISKRYPLLASLASTDVT